MQLAHLMLSLQKNYHGIKKDFKKSLEGGSHFYSVPPCNLLDARNVLLPLAIAASVLRKTKELGSYFQSGGLVSVKSGRCIRVCVCVGWASPYPSILSLLTWEIVRGHTYLHNMTQPLLPS